MLLAKCSRSLLIGSWRRDAILGIIVPGRRQQAAFAGGFRVDSWDHTREAPRAVREYLAVVHEGAWSMATEVEPKFVSPSYSAAKWNSASRG
jgi:hypothetical protein